VLHSVALRKEIAMANDAKVYLLRSIHYMGQVLNGERRVDGEVVEEGWSGSLPLSLASELVHAKKAIYVQEPAPVVEPEPAPAPADADPVVDPAPADPQ
jgi:hypothetical protein